MSSGVIFGGVLMLYDKEVRKICAHCLYGQRFSQEHDLCAKYGPVAPDFTCRHYKYDPLRRRPPAPLGLEIKPGGAFELEEQGEEL